MFSRNLGQLRYVSKVLNFAAQLPGPVSTLLTPTPPPCSAFLVTADSWIRSVRGVLHLRHDIPDGRHLHAQTQRCLQLQRGAYFVNDVSTTSLTLSACLVSFRSWDEGKRDSRQTEIRLFFCTPVESLWGGSAEE